MDEYCRHASLDDLKTLIQSLNREGVDYHLEGIPVRTISLEGLLRTKQTMRDKDVADRHVLERALALYRHKPEQ